MNQLTILNIVNILFGLVVFLWAFPKARRAAPGKEVAFYTVVCVLSATSATIPIVAMVVNR